MKYEFGMMNSEFGIPLTHPGTAPARACIHSEFRIPNSELNGRVV